MRTTLSLIVLAVCGLIQAGCATGFRAGGPHGAGVSAGAALGPSTTPVYTQPPVSLPPSAGETPPPPGIR